MLGERTIEGDPERDTEPCVILNNTQPISDVSDTNDENMLCLLSIPLSKYFFIYTGY